MIKALKRVLLEIKLILDDLIDEFKK